MLEIRKLWEKVLPDLNDKEREYRDFYFSSTVSMQMAVSIFVVFASFTMIYRDLLFAQGDQSQFLYSAVVRVLFFLFTVGAVIFVRQNRVFSKTEPVAAAWVFIASLYFLFFSLNRPPDHLTTSIDILFIFGVYVFYGFRLKYLFPIMLFFSCASIWIAFKYKSDTLYETRVMTTAVHILVQAIGLLAALQIRSFRRRAFLAYIKEREASELATRLAQIDPLTGCFTRRHFLQMAEHELSRAKRYRHPLCVVMMDLDRFKSINDQYGHLVGDQVLTAFAKMAMDQKRQSDVLGRLGGEEFALLLPETTLENAELAAERIRERWEKTEIPVFGLVINSTVSVGVAEMGNSNQDFEELLHNADLLMYKAKSEHHERSDQDSTAAIAA